MFLHVISASAWPPCPKSTQDFLNCQDSPLTFVSLVQYTHPSKLNPFFPHQKVTFSGNLLSDQVRNLPSELLSQPLDQRSLQMLILYHWLELVLQGTDCVRLGGHEHNSGNTVLYHVFTSDVMIDTVGLISPQVKPLVSPVIGSSSIGKLTCSVCFFPCL